MPALVQVAPTLSMPIEPLAERPGGVGERQSARARTSPCAVNRS